MNVLERNRGNLLRKEQDRARRGWNGCELAGNMNIHSDALNLYEEPSS